MDLEKYWPIIDPAEHLRVELKKLKWTGGGQEQMQRGEAM